MNIQRKKLWCFGILRPALSLCASLTLIPASFAATNSALCVDGECQPVISNIKYGGREAYKITDGKTQAIVVPSIGRIMSYGKVDGENLIWNAPQDSLAKTGWINYGGDKNWLAPQTSWSLWEGGWPPDKAFDGEPQEMEVVTGGKLRMTSPLSASTGIRFVRTLYFDNNGELVIEQTAQKEKGEKLKGAVWNITQTVPGDAIFLPLNENSAYKNNYYAFYKGKDVQKTEAVNSQLLRVEPVDDGGGWKIGVDAPVSSLASVRNGVAFVQKTAKPKGIYPDGAVDNAGFPVEIYINGDEKAYYAELEILGPLRDFSIGSKWTHTLRWSVHDLPSNDVKSKEVADAVRALLMEK